MKLNKETGLVSAAKFVASPNFDDRPKDIDIEALVLHCISLPPGKYGGPFIEQLFCNCLDPKEHEYFPEVCHLKVSAHFLIRRNGELIQFVSANKRAWHAGKSCFKNRGNVNDFSVGIELEGIDDGPFEDAQYDTLVQLTNALMSVYPKIKKPNLVAHSDIAPGRKTDPGDYFAWDRYLQQLS